MNTLHIKKGDTVVVLSGKEKGKKGKVVSVNPEKGMAVVEGVNIVTRHTKPRRQGETGGIVKSEGTIRACKLMNVCLKCSKPTRLKHNISTDANGKVTKTRVCKHCGVEI